MKIAVVANTCWYLFNFRSNLMTALRRQGHEVIAIGEYDGYEEKIRDQGVQTHHVAFDGGGVNPVRQLAAVQQIRKALTQLEIDLVLSYTPKGNLYASLAAATLRGKVRQVVNISGLGRVFVRETWLTQVVKRLYKFSLGRAEWIFFQNQEDMGVFLSAGLADPGKCERLPGSGVDLVRFSRSSCDGFGARPDSEVRFLMVARMLWDKGVGQYVAAARALRAEHPQARFQLLGAVQPSNPACVSPEEMSAWSAEGVIEYLGVTDDTRKYLCIADCAVLPSYYREGVPRSLLEAASMGLPIVTTRSTGCRDTVDENVSGLLCEPRDVADLTRALRQVIEMGESARQAMGTAGRMKMEREFSEQIVIDKYLKQIAELSR